MYLLLASSKDMFSEAAFEKVSNKIGVSKNHRTIKRYCFQSSAIKIEFLDLSQLAVGREQCEGIQY